MPKRLPASAPTINASRAAAAQTTERAMPLSKGALLLANAVAYLALAGLLAETRYELGAVRAGHRPPPLGHRALDDDTIERRSDALRRQMEKEAEAGRVDAAGLRLLLHLPPQRIASSLDRIIIESAVAQRRRTVPRPHRAELVPRLGEQPGERQVRDRVG